IRTGNLDARRDFTDVRDIVRAYVLLLESGRAGESYNVGSGKAIPISEMLDMILSCCRVPVRREIDPAKLRPAETAYLAADTTKFQSDTGWRPEIPTAQTIADTPDFWRQKLKEQSEA
ncbi:MAG: GDP-mannose 4,6-dehydratase, partial [Oscillospiraceae bacterium]|nr:GDP-mannose 4,6-dehydratase [Oscillospiraceae bacterium]